MVKYGKTQILMLIKLLYCLISHLVLLYPKIIEKGYNLLKKSEHGMKKTGMKLLKLFQYQQGKCSRGPRRQAYRRHLSTLPFPSVHRCKAAALGFTWRVLMT